MEWFLCFLFFLLLKCRFFLNYLESFFNIVCNFVFCLVFKFISGSFIGLMLMFCWLSKYFVGVGFGIENKLFMSGNNFWWIWVVFWIFLCLNVWIIFCILFFIIWLVIEIMLFLLIVRIGKVKLLFLLYIWKLFEVLVMILFILFKLLLDFFILIILGNFVRWIIVFGLILIILWFGIL